MKRPVAFPVTWPWCLPALLVALAGGVGAGYLDTHVNPPHPHMAMEAIELIFACGVLAGSLCPRLAWLSALLLGLGLPAFHLAVQLGVLVVPRPTTFSAADFLGLVPSLSTSAIGAAGRVFLGRPFDRDVS